MSKVNNLIKELCPNGVEYITLNNIVSISTGKLNANAMVEDGEYAFFTCDANPFRIDTYAFDGEAILISGNGSQVGHLNYYVGKFNAYQRTYVLMNFVKNIIPKYLYHYLNAYLKKHIDLNSKKGSVPYITLPMLQGFKIAVPPIEVQEEIVRILDKFGELEVELEAELEARKSQYEFWRGKILKGGKKTYVNLGSLCKIITKGTTPKKYSDSGINFIKTESFVGDYVDKNKLSFVDEETHNGFLKRSILEANDILFTIAGATIGKMTVVTEELLPANTNQALAIIRLNDGVNLNYIKHILKSDYMKEYIKLCVKGSAQPNLNLQQLNNFEFPFPSIEEQKRVVNILDKFDALVNDITVGIPAEIELRRQQYEYYRNRLLSFEELSCE